MIEENKNPLLQETLGRGKSEKGTPYLAGFFMLVAFGIAGTILGGLLGIPIAAAMSGKSIIDIMDNLQSLAASGTFLREMQLIQTLSAIFGFLLPAIFTAWRLSYKPLALIGIRGEINGKSVLLTLFIIAAALGLSSALGYFTFKLPFPVNWRIQFDRMEANYAETAAGLINLDSIPELLISILVLALVPAVCEEAFFRGGLQNYFYRTSGKLWLSVIVVSIIFSAVHFSVYGFLSRIALGIVLGLLYQYSGKLWLSILAHFINNTMAVVAMYVAKAEGKSIKAVLSDKEGSYLGFLAIPIIIFLFIQFVKTTRSSPTNLQNGV